MDPDEVAESATTPDGSAASTARGCTRYAQRGGCCRGCPGSRCCANQALECRRANNPRRGYRCLPKGR